MFNIKFAPPDISEDEIKAVEEVLRSGWITTGPKTKEFERIISEFCRTERSVCLNSATACMEMTLRLLGIGPGDEVITSAYTYTASCSVIYHVGAVPVLIDTSPDSLEMDYDSLEKSINERTKAIIPVDIGGVMCDYDNIYDIIDRKKNLFRPSGKIQESIGRVVILEDAAHAFGAKRNGKICGEVSDFTCFSFHAVKNLTTSEGGAATWKTIDGISADEIYKEYMLLSLHGQSKDALQKNKAGAWEYDIKYPAYKCNMTDITAALGIAQFKRYPSMLKRRREIISLYNKGLRSPDISTLDHLKEGGESSGHLYILRMLSKDEKYRNRFIEKMAERGIPLNVHYKPLPMHTAYKNLGFNIKHFPNSYNMYKNEVTLPLHTLLTDEEVEYIIKNFKECML